MAIMVKIAVAGGTGRGTSQIQISFPIPLISTNRSCAGGHRRFSGSEEARYYNPKPQCEAEPRPESMV